MDVDRLKSERSRLKAKITSLHSKLLRYVNAEDDAVEVTYRTLEDTFTTFTEVHEQYAELVNVDKETVSGMSCAEYFQRTEELITASMNEYTNYTKRMKEKSASKVMSLISPFMQKAKALYSSDNPNSEIAAEATILLRSLNDYQNRLDLSSITDNDFLNELQLCIHNLELFSIKSEMPSNFHSHSENELPHPRAFHTRSSVVDAYSTPRYSLHAPSVGERTSEPAVGSNQSNLPQVRAKTKFKKSPPPVFDGTRKNWYEFRSVWRSYAAIEYANDEERAWALKQSLQGNVNQSY